MKFLVITLFVISTIGVPTNTLGEDGDCQIPKNFPNGRLRATKREYRNRTIVPSGVILQFRCEEGHVLTGAPRVKCTNGTWIPQLPICAAPKVAENETECKECCETPRNFTNGKIKAMEAELLQNEFMPEMTQLRFTCDPGYGLDGVNGSLCVKKEWHPEIPRCIRSGCLPPPVPKHGRIVSDSEGRFPVGANITYKCDDGYQLVQESALTCSEGFLWRGEVPRCEEKSKCKDPGSGSNAFKDGWCCEIGDILVYSCVDEFEIVGPSAIICTDAGTWNATRPRCQPKKVFCDVPDKLANGQFRVKRNRTFSIPDEGVFSFPGDEVIIKCDRGYTVGDENSDYLFCTDNGRWDEDIPECIPVSHCDIPKPPEKGYIVELKEDKNLTSLPYDSEINFACYPGYRLTGNSWRGCEEYGWTFDNPRCEEIRCPDPRPPENGWSRGTDFRIGNVTYFGCSSGYNLLGSHKRVCLENGQWSGELSRCDNGESYCPNPGTPIGGTKIGRIYDLDSKIQFDCNPGRILIGSANRTCQPNKEWSGEEAKCFGENDFDDKRAVGDRIKAIIHNDSIHGVEQGHLIIVFIFHISGNVGESDFNKSISFAKGIVKAVKMDESGARIGAITFSRNADIEISPVDGNNEKEVLEGLSKIEYKKGGTATSSALTLLKDQMMPLTIEVLGKDSKFVAFLMTDGKANMAGNPIHDAQALKDEGVEIFCIGITGDRRMATLHDIASSKDKHVFILDSYESLNWLAQDIVNDKPDYSKCGVRKSTLAEIQEEPLDRLLNHKKIVKNWPWMAIMFTVDPMVPDVSKPKSVCGSSLISKKWLLTASHCMHHAKDKVGWKIKEEFLIYLGVTDIANSTYLQKRSVAGFITHPSYSRDTFDYDIALVEVSRPVVYNEFIRPICLPPSSKNKDTEPIFYNAGQKAAVFGWGYNRAIKLGQRLSSKHQQVDHRTVITMQTRAVCTYSLKNYPEHYVFTDQMVCAGGGKQDTCRGDSGGPLMRKIINDIGEEYWTAAGVVSWDFGCGQPGTYSFYTKVSVFTEWIEDNMEKEYCKNGGAEDLDKFCHY